MHGGASNTIAAGAPAAIEHRIKMKCWLAAYRPRRPPLRGSCRCAGSHFRLGAGAAGDQPVMLGAPVLLEIEHGAPQVLAELEVRRSRDKLVLLGQRQARDL